MLDVHIPDPGGGWTLIGTGSSNYDITDLWDNGYRVIYTPHYTRLTWDGTRYAFSDKMDVDYYLAQEDRDFHVGRDLAHLLGYVGTHKLRGLLREVRPALESLLGNELPDFLEYTVDFGDIELSGHFLVAYDPPRMRTQAILVVDLYDGSVHAAMRPGRERQIYSNAPRWEEIPWPIRAWVFQEEIGTLVKQEPESGVVWQGASEE